jgi:hypothetical protein
VNVTAPPPRDQFPFADDLLPAWDMGLPYFARLSGVSGIGLIDTVDAVGAADIPPPLDADDDIPPCDDGDIGSVMG